MSNLGDAIGSAMAVIAIILVVSIPLALWKLVEIVIWIFQHIDVSVK